MVLLDSAFRLVAVDLASGRRDTLVQDLSADGRDSLLWFMTNNYNDDVLLYRRLDSTYVYDMRQRRVVLTLNDAIDSSSYPIRKEYAWTVFPGNGYYYFSTAGKTGGKGSSESWLTDTLGMMVKLDSTIVVYEFETMKVEKGPRTVVLKKSDNRIIVLSLDNKVPRLLELPKERSIEEGDVFHWSPDSTVYTINHGPLVTYARANGEVSVKTLNILDGGVHIDQSTGKIIIVTETGVLTGDPRHLDSLDETPFDRSYDKDSYYCTISSDGRILTMNGYERTARMSDVHVLSGPGYATRSSMEFSGFVYGRLPINSKEGMIVIRCIDTTGHVWLRVYDMSLTKVLYSQSIGMGDFMKEFSPTGRYMALENEVIDVRTWKSTYVIGGDYNVNAERGAFLDNDKYYARSTSDFGIYVYNLQANDDQSYKKFPGRAYFSENGKYAWVVDSNDVMSCVRTSDWQVISTLKVPFGFTYYYDFKFGKSTAFPHPSACAIAFKNKLNSLYIWYPLTSTVTSVPEESIEPTHALRGDPQAVSIRCRNGSAQLVVETEPETNSLRVVDVLGREVAFTMENRTLRLVNCRPGYHAITYRHAGHSVNIPVMVVEE
jgi:hypothetical protein